MKRKLIILAMAAALCSGALLAGCGEEPTPSGTASVSSSADTPSSSTPQDSSTPAASAPETNADGKGTIGDYGIEILGVRIDENYSGDKVAVVKLKFSNISNEDATSFFVQMNPKIYQDGVELQFSSSNNEETSETQYTNVKKGASIEIEYGVKLSNTTSPIEVEVSETSAFANTGKVTKTLELPKE